MRVTSEGSVLQKLKRGRSIDIGHKLHLKNVGWVSQLSSTPMCSGLVLSLQGCITSIFTEIPPKCLHPVIAPT